MFHVVHGASTFHECTKEAHQQGADESSTPPVRAPVDCPTRHLVSIVKICLSVIPFGKAVSGVTVASWMGTFVAPPPSGGGFEPARTMLASTSIFSTTWLRCLILSTICSYRLLIQLFSLSRNVSHGPHHFRKQDCGILAAFDCLPCQSATSILQSL